MTPSSGKDSETGARSLKGSLHGIRILDASRVLAGPFATQMLGDLGAEIIKIEQPGTGDETRGWGPPFAQELSSYFSSCNRNKKSVTLNLKDRRGREIFASLAARSDIVFENFTATTRSRLGFDSHTLHAVNPGLIIVSVTSFGKSGPFAQHPGYDFAMQAMSGLMSITGPADGPPSKVGVAIVDIVTGLYAANAALAALHARTSNGPGSHGYAIEVSLLDCAAALQANVLQAFIDTGVQPQRQGNAHLQIVPYQLFQTSDGWIVLAVGNDSQWQRFCEAAELLSLAADEKYKTNERRVRNREPLVEKLRLILRTRSTTAWRDLLAQAEVPHSPVWGYADLLSSDIGKSRGIRIRARRPDGQEVELVRSPLLARGDDFSAPPKLGEHTDEVLLRVLQIDSLELDRLKKNGVI